MKSVELAVRNVVMRSAEIVPDLANRQSMLHQFYVKCCMTLPALDLSASVEPNVHHIAFPSFGL